MILRIPSAARSFSPLIILAALSFILLGFLLSPAWLIDLLGNQSVNREEMRQGVLLLKIMLVIVGLAIPIAATLSSSIAKSNVHETERSDKREGRATLVLISAFLIVATLLRLYRLDEGLWLDEILTYVKYAQEPFGTLLSTYDSENQHFLYSALARAAFLIFGEGVVALRLPAVLFGVGSLWALFLLGRQATSVHESILATALMTFSYHHLWFSQNARGYTGLLFWALLSSWLLLRAIDEKRTVLWLLYGLSVALGMYTHLTMLFMVLGHGTVYLLALLKGQLRRRWWQVALLGFGSAILFTILLHALVLPQMMAVAGREVSVVEAWKSPLWTLVELVRGLQVGFAGAFIATAAVILFGAGFVSYLKSEPRVPLLLVVPAFTGLLFLVTAGHHIWPRFFFFTFGFGALIVVRGVLVAAAMAGRLLRWPESRSITVGIALATLMVMVSAASMVFAYGPKQDYEAALRFINEERGPDDQVVLAGLTAFPYQQLYGVDWPVVESDAELEAIRALGGETWVVYTFPTVLEAVAPDVMQTLDEEFRQVAQFPGTVARGAVLVSVAE